MSTQEGSESKRLRTSADESNVVTGIAPIRKLKIKKKVYPSVAQYPTVDFRALLETEREKIEHESNAVISMRGKGSGHEDDKEMLHVLIEAESEDQAHRAERMVRDVLNDPSKLPPPVQTQIVVRQSIFGARPPRDSQQNRAGEFVKEVRVPEAVAGGIIGRAGETVKRMQSQTNTRIHINRDAGAYDDGTRVIVIRGATQESVDDCERLILEFAQNRPASRERVVAASAEPTTNVRDASSSPPKPEGAGGPGHTNGRYQRPNDIVDYHTVPNHRAGAVIGRQGATIKSLQSRYRARITVPPAADPANPSMRTITISAESPQAIQAIKQEIDAIIEGKAGYVGNPQDIATPVRIPDDKAGLVIGKQGATIKSIQERLQVKVQIPPQVDDPSDPIPYRTAMVIGRPDMVALAVREVEAVVTGEISAGVIAAANTPGVSVFSTPYPTASTTAYGHAQQYQQIPPVVPTSQGGSQQYSSQAEADYAKQWEEYYEQLRKLPPDQQKIALEQLAEHQKSLGMQQ